MVAVGGIVGRDVLVGGSWFASESCINVGTGVYLAASGSGRSQPLTRTAAVAKKAISRGTTLEFAD